MHFLSLEYHDLVSLPCLFMTSCCRQRKVGLNLNRKRLKLCVSDIRPCHCPKVVEWILPYSSLSVLRISSARDVFSERFVASCRSPAVRPNVFRVHTRSLAVFPEERCLILLRAGEGDVHQRLGEEKLERKAWRQWLCGAVIAKRLLGPVVSDRAWEAVARSRVHDGPGWRRPEALVEMLCCWGVPGCVQQNICARS